jgi:hypothetical protein
MLLFSEVHVVESIAEVLWLTIDSGVTIFVIAVMLVTLRTRAATVATVGSVLTGLTAVATLWTLRALTTGRTLHVALGLWNEHTVRQLVLACLGVNLKQLHGELVALLDASLLNGLKTLPVNLADVEQAVLARHNLDETSVRHDAANSSLVDLANFRHSHDGANLANSGINALLVGARYLHLANAVLFVNGDGGLSVLLHLLDNLTTRANDSTDELLRNL